MKKKKEIKTVTQEAADLLYYRVRLLENTRMLYEKNTNLPANVRMANVQLVQNDIIACKKRLKKRTGKLKISYV